MNERARRHWVRVLRHHGFDASYLDALARPDVLALQYGFKTRRSRRGDRPLSFYTDAAPRATAVRGRATAATAAAPRR